MPELVPQWNYEEGVKNFEENTICGLMFVHHNGIVAPTLHPRSIAGWRKTLIAAMLLASAPGICLAQWFGTGGAFLPSPVRSASTVPPNGDVNPYGVAFVPNNFITGSGH